MTQIRNTIDLLTKILQANGTTQLKAEIFRLAKFDRPEAVCIFICLPRGLNQFMTLLRAYDCMLLTVNPEFGSPSPACAEFKINVP